MTDTTYRKDNYFMCDGRKHKCISVDTDNLEIVDAAIQILKDEARNELYNENYEHVISITELLKSMVEAKEQFVEAVKEDIRNA